MSECVSAPSRPLRADAERNRRRILAAAAEVFARRGLEAGLDEIARHAGVGTGTVYRRFPDKMLLVEALVDQRMREMEELAEDAVRAPDAWEGLVHLLSTFVERAVADRALMDMVFSDCGDVLPGLQERKARLQPILTELLDRAKQQGTLRPDVEVTDLAMVQFMLVSGGCFGDGRKPDLWRRHLGVVMDGLRARREAPTPLPGDPLTLSEFEAVCGPPAAARRGPVAAPARPARA